MKYIRIKLKGFRPLIHQTKGVVEIKNLDKYKVIGIFGAMGTGKSTILKEISPFCNPTMYVGKDAYKEVEFEYNGNIYLCVSKPTQKHYQIFKNGNLVMDTQKGNITQYLQYINDYLFINKNISYFFDIKGKDQGMLGMSPIERKKSFLDINPILEKIYDMYIKNIKPVNSNLKHDMNSMIQNLKKSNSLEYIQGKLKIAEDAEDNNDDAYTKIINDMADNRNAIETSKNSMDSMIKQADIGEGYTENYDVRKVKAELLNAREKYSTTTMETVIKLIAKYTDSKDISVAIGIIQSSVDDLIPKLKVNEGLLKEHDEKSLNVEIANNEATLRHKNNDKIRIINDINIINTPLQVNINTLSGINISDCKLLVNDISRYFFTDINHDRIVNIFKVNPDIEKNKLRDINLQIERAVTKQSRIVESAKIVNYLDGSKCADTKCEYKRKVDSLKDDENIDEYIKSLRVDKANLETLISNYDYSKGKIDIIEDLISRINSSKVLQLLSKYTNVTKEFVYNMLEKASFSDLLRYIENIKIYIKKIYDLKILLNDLIDINERISILDKSIEVLKKNVNNSLLNNIKQRHITNKTEYKELTHDLEILSPVRENARLFALINNKLDSLSLYENEIITCQTTIAKSKLELESLAIKMRELVNNKKSLRQSIEYLKTELHVVTSLTDNIDSIKQDMDVYRELDNLFDPKKGISVSILQQLTKNLKGLTNDILQKTFDGESQLEIDITVDDAKFNIDVFKDEIYQGDARSAASDGETDLIKLAIHIAFCLLLKQNKTMLNVLKLDEIDAHLDVGMNKARFAKLVPYMTNVLKFSQVFIISHNNNLLTDNMGLVLLPNYSLDIINSEHILYELKG